MSHWVFLLEHCFFHAAQKYLATKEMCGWRNDSREQKEKTTQLAGKQFRSGNGKSKNIGAQSISSWQQINYSSLLLFCVYLDSQLRLTAVWREMGRQWKTSDAFVWTKNGHVKNKRTKWNRDFIGLRAQEVTSRNCSTAHHHFGLSIIDCGNQKVCLASD